MLRTLRANHRARTLYISALIGEILCQSKRARVLTGWSGTLSFSSDGADFVVPRLTLLLLWESECSLKQSVKSKEKVQVRGFGLTQRRRRNAFQSREN